MAAMVFLMENLLIEKVCFMFYDGLFLSASIINHCYQTLKVHACRFDINM